MQLVTASDTAHLISDNSSNVGLSCAVKADTTALAADSFTEYDGRVTLSSFIRFFFFIPPFPLFYRGPYRGLS